MKYFLALILIAAALAYQLVPMNKTNDSITRQQSATEKAPIQATDIPIIDTAQAQARVQKRFEKKEIIAAIETTHTSPIKEKPLKGQPFDEQPIDYEWADSFTHQIHEIFINDESLAQFNLKDIECRSTTCQLKVYMNDKGQIEQAVAFGRALKSGALQDHPFYFVNKTDTDVITIELDRYRPK